MKTLSLKLVLAFFIGVLFLAPLISSCKEDSSSKIFWFRDPNGRFHTNDVARAQKEIPFTIVIPSYLPYDIDPIYSSQIVGPFTHPYRRGVEVEISYSYEDSRIYISEQNNTFVMEPTEELDPVYLDIAGTKVLRQKARMGGSSGITEGLRFDWN